MIQELIRSIREALAAIEGEVEDLRSTLNVLEEELKTEEVID